MALVPVRLFLVMYLNIKINSPYFFLPYVKHRSTRTVSILRQRLKINLQLVSQFMLLLLLIKNDLVEEARQVFSDWYSQVVRLYKGEKYAEFEWTLGPIPIEYVCFS